MNATCTVATCDNPSRSRKGLCVAHYKRLRRYGDPEGGGPMRVKYASVEDRFWIKVDKSGGPNACWPWKGSCDGQGYGQFSWRAIRISPVKSSRVAYLFTHGVWPSGEVLHSCDNPPCVNPAHLSDGTHQQNLRDASTRGRWNPVTRLTADQVREIRSRSAAGESQTSIAAGFGVHQSNVSCILSGKTWSHVR